MVKHAASSSSSSGTRNPPPKRGSILTTAASSIKAKVGKAWRTSSNGSNGEDFHRVSVASGGESLSGDDSRPKSRGSVRSNVSPAKSRGSVRSSVRASVLGYAGHANRRASFLAGLLDYGRADRDAAACLVRAETHHEHALLTSDLDEHAQLYYNEMMEDEMTNDLFSEAAQRILSRNKLGEASLLVELQLCAKMIALRAVKRMPTELLAEGRRILDQGLAEVVIPPDVAHLAAQMSSAQAFAKLKDAALQKEKEETECMRKKLDIVEDTLASTKSKLDNVSTTLQNTEDELNTSRQQVESRNGTINGLEQEKAAMRQELKQQRKTLAEVLEAHARQESRRNAIDKKKINEAAAAAEACRARAHRCSVLLESGAQNGAAIDLIEALRDWTCSQDKVILEMCNAQEPEDALNVLTKRMRHLEKEAVSVYSKLASMSGTIKELHDLSIAQGMKSQAKTAMMDTKIHEAINSTRIFLRQQFKDMSADAAAELPSDDDKDDASSALTPSLTKDAEASSNAAQALFGPASSNQSQRAISNGTLLGQTQQAQHPDVRGVDGKAAEPKRPLKKPLLKAQSIKFSG